MALIVLLFPAAALGQDGHAPTARPAVPTLAAGLADLSLEELRDVVVFSVSRRRQPLAEVAASLYVISGDEIRRSGATTLPEALRLAPNLQVAAIDARQYAISARGFNGNVANKLLVLVDGRTVYSPLFSGVFWDAQDFVPADIDRIEVLSGPAGVGWGTNAVNGVINVVTRPASRTLGTSASATLGTLGQTLVARHGLKLTDELSVRGHLRAYDRDASRLVGGGDASDASSGIHAGVRADWERGVDSIRLIANAFEGKTDDRPLFGSVDLSGANFSARWLRRIDADHSFDIHAYYDDTNRTDQYLLQEAAEIFDIEAKYRFVAGRHRWLAGVGYRHAHDRADPGLLFAFVPPDAELEWYSVFVQDEIALTDRLSLTLGMRLEHNTYTDWESMPSVRVGYKLSPGSLLWAALSRAVRTPARFDRALVAPSTPPYFLIGGADFRSEIANVAELGYRGQFGPDLSVSATAFVHDFDRLRSGELIGGQLSIANRIEGQVRGVEAWGSWHPVRRWRLDAGLLWLDHGLRNEPGSTDPIGPANLGNDARLQWSVRSTHTIGATVDLTLGIRQVDELPSPYIAGYTAADLTLNWRVRDDTQLTFGVRNAFEKHHPEYQGFATVSEIPRSAFVAIRYQPN